MYFIRYVIHGILYVEPLRTRIIMTKPAVKSA